jgi:A/G-specific adenine glycosylase
VNIQRVLSRLAKPMKHIHDKLSTKEVYDLDTAILPHGKSSLWHEALMDLGSTICVKNNPRCSTCPLRSFCPSAVSMLRAAKPKAITESIYFGQPRRIWRGRVLAEIMKNKKVTLQKLVGALEEHYAVSRDELSAFVSDIVDRLIVEGFIRKEGRWLCLA